MNPLSFRTLSIRRKQVLIIMLTSSVALLLACGAFVAYDTITFREQLVIRQSTVAGVLGKTVTAAIDFNDPKTAVEVLDALRGEPNVVWACVYNSDGRVFAGYRRDGGTKSIAFPHVKAPGHEFLGNQLRVYLDINQSGGKVGTILVASDLDELSQRMRRYAGIVGLVFVTSLLIALAVSSRLQRVVSDPILQLAQVARSVALKKDYAVRVTRQSSDELGQLIDGFNEMLDQIQQRDAALETARDQLERRVEERTAELAESLSLLNATLGSTAEGILVVNNHGKRILQNQQLIDLWKIPRSLAEGYDDDATVQHVMNLTQEPDRFRETVRYFYAHPEEIGHDEIELKDGTILERLTAPVLGKSGRNYGRIWTFRDITERKRSEAKIEQAHQQMLETSRMAGMAEVATSVLHNVGNVLNSVNISTSLVLGLVKKSRLKNLGRLAAMISQHQGDLAAFFTIDSRGKQLPDYLTKLAQHLADEQAALVAEIELTRKNIDHIKEVVTMQQNYAKVSGVVEQVNLADLAEDALRMNAAALARHNVQVVREYPAEAIECQVERHKVLQILVNLIRNAQFACDDSGRRDKRLILKVLAGNGRAQIAVQDNGVGIPAENMTRIFNHGFTTREQGHGFGLHSGALAAKELGGSLAAHSDGPGTGATFVLDLPLQASR
ncbi:MAG: CHASE sensor domain-containing protein [Verrucomicrobiota bacterium]